MTSIIIIVLLGFIAGIIVGIMQCIRSQKSYNDSIAEEYKRAEAYPGGLEQMLKDQGRENIYC